MPALLLLYHEYDKIGEVSSVYCESISRVITCPQACPQRNYPLTNAQRNIWLAEKLFPGTSINMIAATVRIKNDVDYHLLEKALNLFIEKNDSVRIRIREVDREPLQYVMPFQHQKFDFRDFKDDLNSLYAWDEKESQKPLPVLNAQLFEFVLIRINDDDGGFFLKFHHLIADAWTMALLANQVIEYYSALKKGLPISPEKKPSFIDYLKTVDDYKGSDRFSADQDYWNQKFADWQEVTALKNRKDNENTFKARRKTLLIPKKLSAKLHEYCLQNRVSEFSLFLAAVSMYINRVTGKEDLVLGTTLLNRSNYKEKETTGLFANVAVPLRFSITDDMNFDAFVEIVSKEILTVLRHQKYSYDLILKHIRECGKSPDMLFDLVVTYQNSKVLKKDEFEDYITRWHFSGSQIESLIININDRESDGRLIIDYDYLTDLFYATEIEFIHQHIINLLWHALDNPQKTISRLEMLSEKEKFKILHRFNDTAADFPKDKTIPQIFREQVEKTPEKPAVYFRGQSLTYREMDEKTNQLAALLRAKGVKPQTIVGIMLDRSIEMVAGILGIIKAGGAYLPMDPHYPADRIAFMLNDCGAGILLTDRKWPDKAFGNAEVIDIKDRRIFEGQDRREDVELVNAPGDLAYVIYTSGSTGYPKGVMIEHRSLINRICWMQKKYPLDENSIILQKTPFTFDVSVWELVWWFFAGAGVCMLEPGGEKDPSAIIAAVRKYQVTTLHFVPPMLNMFLLFLENGKGTQEHLQDIASLKHVFSSGEALGLKQADSFNRLLNKANGTELHNLYGPTEAAIDVSYFDCLPDIALKSVPIGKPIDNTRLYILDSHLNLLPIGIPGELHIGGVGLSRGYMNRPDLTAEKFVPDPFVPGEKIYKTGDLVRWYAEGDIEYLGRLDHQVKIRGFRIELGEIEDKLLACPGIREAAVAGIEIGEKKFLCAYYVSKKRISAAMLKRFLAGSLPEYMIPSQYVRLETLPLLPNGKIDRKALPLPPAGDGKAKYAPPRNDFEKRLANIFQDVLGVKEVGIDDNLFNIGGDSLSVIQIYSIIYDFNWGLTAEDFYQYRTIRELSNKVGAKTQPAASPQDREFGIVERKVVPDETNDPGDAGEEYKLQNVFLTGATGFLGAHLLDNLMQNTSGTVYCLVRGENEQAAEDRLRQALVYYFNGTHDELVGQRIFVLRGDLAEEKFGLDPATYDTLGNTIDTVFHAAAIVKYFGDYDEVEKTNVGGTKEAIDFALRYNLKLNYISTDAITGNYLVDNPVAGNFTENDFYVGQNFQGNIYVRSKFEAENCVLLAIKQGLKATIYRMGNLTGRHSDGHFQRNMGENAFYSTLRSALKLGAVSEELLMQPIEFSPVELASDAIIRVARTRGSDNRVFHVFNHHTMMMKDLVEILDGMGYLLKVKSKEDMDRFIHDEIDEQTRRDVLPGLMIYLGKTGELAFCNSLAINSDISVEYLKKLGFQWPSADAEYLAKLVEAMRKSDFLKG
jgi:amino acid adenylation domain-containing protein/thioester reductase-like protein